MIRIEEMSVRLGIIASLYKATKKGRATARPSSVIRKSGYRFSEKIMLRQQGLAPELKPRAGAV
jgi:hypothetical protein